MINSLKYARPCIKTKLFEIAKEIKDFKFQKNWRIEIKKQEKALNQKIFEDLTIDELLEKQHNDLSARIENRTHESLGSEFIQCYYINFLFPKSLFLKEVDIFHGSKN